MAIASSFGSFRFVGEQGQHFYGSRFTCRQEGWLIQGDFEIEQIPPARFTVGNMTIWLPTGQEIRFAEPMIIENVEAVLERTPRYICHFTNDVARLLAHAEALRQLRAWVGTSVEYAAYVEFGKATEPVSEEVSPDALRELLGSPGDGAAEVWESARFNAEGGIQP